MTRLADHSCLDTSTESPLRQDGVTRDVTKELQEFRRWAVLNGKVSAPTDKEALAFLGAYLASVQSDMATLACCA
jgi:hypothetical protein